MDRFENSRRPVKLVYEEPIDYLNREEIQSRKGTFRNL